MFESKNDNNETISINKFMVVVAEIFIFIITKITNFE